ncbi:MAG: hypothetical protein LBM04_04500 [Opitutaceae bacterium]|jgi:hypothetical protein|nr:hypothetical protein [Opitutaceae bacterium]
MEIDHHNPKLKGRKRHAYENLFPATRHCNGAKSNTWPAKMEHQNGLRFLNPCKEADYNFQIFEKPNGELVGTTPAATWHIRKLDLNAPHLINRRRQRTFVDHLSEQCILQTGDASDSEMMRSIQIFLHMRKIQIPKILPPPA